MIKLYKNGAYLINGTQIVEAGNENELKAACGCCVTPEEGRKGTIAYSILMNHNTANSQEHLKIRFDAMASHDITYVGIIQTARASGMGPSVVRLMKMITFSVCRQLKNTVVFSCRLI